MTLGHNLKRFLNIYTNFLNVNNLTIGTTGIVNNLNADKLDNFEGSHYLNYNNFTNTPTIPTAVSNLTNDSGFITNSLSGALDLNGNELILDTDGDTSITADADDRIDFKIANGDQYRMSSTSFAPVFNNSIELGASNARWSTLYTNNLNVSSTAVVTNLNADYLDGFSGIYYLDYNHFTNTPTIPSNTSDLTNDSGFVTSADGGNADRVDGLHAYQFLRSDTGDSAFGNISFITNNTGARFGSGGNLFIFFDGTNGRIQTAGSTPVAIQTDNDFKVTKENYTETMAIFNADGAVELYHDNTKRIETKSDGAKVTGDLEITGGLLDLKNDGNAVSQIKLYCESNNAHAQTIQGAPHSSASSAVLVLPDNSGTLVATGDIGSVSTNMIADDAVTASKLNNTTVTAGSYTSADITVDAQGRITAASSGTGGSGSTNADTVDNKHIAVVSSLPASPDANTIYFIT